MGSICYCLRKECWEVLKEGRLKANVKSVYEVKVGEYDDYPECGIMSMFMLKSVYEKIMTGEYSVIHQPYSYPPVLITDQNNNIINPLE